MINLAVVTGGKAFDVPGFHRLFNRMQGVESYIQHIDDFASSAEAVRNSYDGVLFFFMMTGEPLDEGLPGYCGKPRSVLKELLGGDQGILLLHHGILSYPDWPQWDDLTGIQNRRLTRYSHDERVNVFVKDPEHPVTRSLEDWTMTDETYLFPAPEESCRILLSTDHHDNSPALAWTREMGEKRIFCFQSGHDAQTWENPLFQKTLHRGIRWICKEIHA